jgi:hypothetical protein
MSEPTITENMALYRAQNNARLKQIRRELRKLERRSWWARLKAFLKK